MTTIHPDTLAHYRALRPLACGGRFMPATRALETARRRAQDGPPR